MGTAGLKSHPKARQPRRVETDGGAADALGDEALLRRRTLALICSQKCPGDVILKTYDFARLVRDSGSAIVSGVSCGCKGRGRPDHEEEGRTRMNSDVIGEIVSRITRTADPEKIILFGSRARGDARDDSDFDVLVIKESLEPRYRRSIPLYIALANLPVEVEVMVYTPQEVEEWSRVPQAFVTTAVHEGIVVYEKSGRP